VIISNPPYFKIPKEGPHAQAAITVVHGQPNIYGLFMAVGAALLRQGGEFVFITPRSFASGPYFQQFRQQFFQMIRPQQVHVFGSRREAFSRDEVLQENVILRGVREDGWSRRGGDHEMVISTTAGVGDLSAPVRRVERLAAILDLESKDKVLRLPVSSEDDEAIKLVDSWQGSLQAYGMNISTGPVVPIRAREFLDDVGEHPRTHAPLLWMQHVHALRVTWPNGCRKAQYIKDEPTSRPLLVPNRNYVLMRRFSAKEEHRRLTAAPFLAKHFKGHWVGLENHLNYIHRPGGTLTEEETWGLAALLSSALLDTYFRISNGNTQVSATELRAMPLPDLDIIRALGREVMALEDPAAQIDDLVLRMVSPTKMTRAKREPKRSRRWTKSSKPA
jgi:adenine-specific DNA-methyltransferase